MKPRFELFVSSDGMVQLRDTKPDRYRKPDQHGIVAVFPTLGSGWRTWQSHKESRRLARRICRFLNGEL